MLLHKYGGVYIDLDVECLKPMSFSGDHAIVLQGSGVEGVTNAMMASAPGNPFWLTVLESCQKRAQDPKYDGPIVQTGPLVVGEAMNSYFKVSSWHRAGFAGLELQVH